MRLVYYQDTDSLDIDLSDRPSVDSREIAPGLAIDIDHASRVVDLARIDAESLPVTGLSISAA